MAPPTLQQLLNYYRNHPLPSDVDPSFEGVTISHLPTCGPSDVLKHRMLGYPDSQHNVLFLPPNQVPAKSTFPNPDDLLLRRFVSATGGLIYSREIEGRDGRRIPAG